MNATNASTVMDWVNANLGMPKVGDLVWRGEDQSDAAGRRIVRVTRDVRFDRAPLSSSFYPRYKSVLCEIEAW